MGVVVGLAELDKEAAAKAHVLDDGRRVLFWKEYPSGSPHTYVCGEREPPGGPAVPALVPGWFRYGSGAVPEVLAGTAPISSGSRGGSGMVPEALTFRCAGTALLRVNGFRPFSNGHMVAEKDLPN